MGKRKFREYIFEDKEFVRNNTRIENSNLKLVIPINVEIINEGILIVGALQIYGYEFDMRYMINREITLPTGNLTKAFLNEFINEFEGIIPYLGDNTIESADWF